MSHQILPEAFAQKEDSPHTDGHLGVMMLGVRNHLTGSTTDGDYAAISVSSTGEMQTLARRDLQRFQSAFSFGASPPAAYVSGDQFGGLFTITNAARVSGGSGTIVGVMIQTASDLTGAFDVVFFDSSVTLAGDSAPFAISDTDILKAVAVVPIAGSYDLGTNRIAQAFNIAVPYICTGSTSLYAAVISRSAFTMLTADFASQFTVFLERN